MSDTAVFGSRTTSKQTARKAGHRLRGAGGRNAAPKWFWLGDGSGDIKHHVRRASKIACRFLSPLVFRPAGTRKEDGPIAPRTASLKARGGQHHPKASRINVEFPNPRFLPKDPNPQRLRASFWPELRAVFRCLRRVILTPGFDQRESPRANAPLGPACNALGKPKIIRCS